MWDQEGLSQFSNEQWNPDMLAVYPQGVDVSLNWPTRYLVTDMAPKKEWEGAPYAPSSSHPDKAFTTSLLIQLRSEYCIDDDRIYASGMSNGGGFVDTLACSNEHGADFAAFAPVSGAFYDDMPEDTTCQPARSPMPLLEFHGHNTAHIP